MRRTPIKSHNKKRNLVLGVLFGAGLLLLFTLVYFIGDHLERSGQQMKAGAPGAVASGLLEGGQDTEKRKGQQYVKRQDLTSILMIGVDTGESADTQAPETPAGGRAVYFSVFVIDDKDKSIHRISIAPEAVAAMTPDAQGNPQSAPGAITGQSRFDGSGRPPEADTILKSVGNLLHDAKIDDYISFSLEAIPIMNELAGGVRVKLDEDLTRIDPSFRKGHSVTLTGKQAELFFRAQENTPDESGFRLIQRQNAFMLSFLSAAAGKIIRDASIADQFKEALSPFVATNMDWKQMLPEAIKSVAYAKNPPVMIAGDYGSKAPGSMESFPAGDSLRESLIDVFYETSIEDSQEGT